MINKFEVPTHLMRLWNKIDKQIREHHEQQLQIYNIQQTDNPDILSKPTFFYNAMIQAYKKLNSKEMLKNIQSNN